MRCIKRDLAVLGVVFAHVQSKMARIYAQDAGGGKTQTTKNADCIGGKSAICNKNNAKYDKIPKNYKDIR